MMATEDEARAQVEKNDPEFKSGQIWRLIPTYAVSAYPQEIRIVCRYPFNTPEDGRSWIFESAYSISHLAREPELTLRQIYELYEDVQS
jgi:hypothetical protein